MTEKWQSGDIIFFKGKSVISRIISALTGSPYTHVALCMSEDTILEADRFIKTRIRTIRKDEVYCVMRCEHVTPSDRKTMTEYGLTMIGMKYDYLEVLKWSFRLVFNYGNRGIVNNANRTYCSKLIDTVYRKIGIVLVSYRNEGDVLPSHLLHSALLTEVYNSEGRD